MANHKPKLPSKKELAELAAIHQALDILKAQNISFVLVAKNGPNIITDIALLPKTGMAIVAQLAQAQVKITNNELK